MENNDLDQIFRAGIDRDFEFSGQEKQWETIAAQLHPKSRRRILWWWPFSGLLMLASALWILGSLPKIEAFPVDFTPSATTSITRTSVPQPLVASVSSKPIIPVGKPHKQTNNKQVKTKAQHLTNAVSSVSEEHHLILNSIVDRVEAEEEQPQDVEPKHTTYSYDARARRITHLELGSAVALRDAPIVSPLDRIDQELAAKRTATIPPIQFGRNQNSSRFTLLAGWQNAFTRDEAVQEETSTNMYIGIAAKLHGRWEGILRFSQGSYQRTTEQTPATYNIPLVDIPVGFTSPQGTELHYDRQVLEVGLRHRLPFFRSPRFYLQSGLLMARNKQLSATYAYQNIYQNFVVEAQLEDQSWHGAAVFVGGTIALPLWGTLSANAGYQFYRELNPQYLQWRSSQQWQLGLSYQF